MTNERKEPHLSDLGPAAKQDRIPTLYDTVAPDLFKTRRPGPSGLSIPGKETAPIDDNDRVDEPAPEESATAVPPAITVEAIEALSDRVLDQIAPALREAVTAAVTELLNPPYRESH
jgi:hypothetical protein